LIGNKIGYTALLLRLILVLLFTFITLDAQSNKSAFEYLNSIRQEAGLISFKSNKKLDKAAS